MEGPVQAAGMGPVIRGVEETSALAPDSLITQEHSLQLVENLRKIYDEEDCFLHDVTLVSNECGEVRPRATTSRGCSGTRRRRGLI